MHRLKRQVLLEVLAMQANASARVLHTPHVQQLRALEAFQYETRRVVLDLSNTNIRTPRDLSHPKVCGAYVLWVPATISAHPAVRSRRFLVDLRE